MNITLENTDKLTSTIKVEVSAADYSGSIDKLLRDYQKKASMPGFRPGKIPMGMVKKMYGKGLVAEEVNKVATDNLLKYIEENNLEILGSPLPNMEKTQLIDWEENSDYTFFYDLGLAPQADVTLNDVKKMDYLKISVDEKFIDGKVEELRRRFGKFSKPDVTTEADWLYGEFTELNEDGSVKEEGKKNRASLLIDAIKAKKDKKQFVGLKVDDTVEFVPSEILANTTDAAQMVGMTTAEFEVSKAKFRFQLETINRIELAEMDQDFFDKTYGKGTISTEAELRAKIAEDFDKAYSGESDRKLMNDVVLKLIEKSKMELPEAFLKRWLRQQGENKLTDEQIENEFGAYMRSLKWSIIENKLLKENNIAVQEEDVMSHAKELVRQQLAMYGKTDSTDEELSAIALRVFENKDELKKLYDKLYDEKLIAFFKENIELKVKEVSFDKFLEEAKKEN